MEAIPWLVVLGAGLSGAAWDVRTRRIPNLLTFPIFAGALAWHLYTGGWSGFGEAWLGAVVAALPFLLLFFAGCGGAGDAKMMAALGGWLAWPNGVWLLLAVTVSGAVLGLAYSIWLGRGGLALSNLGRMTGRLAGAAPGAAVLRQWAGAWPSAQGMTPMPYGVAIFAGGCLAAAGVWIWS